MCHAVLSERPNRLSFHTFNGLHCRQYDLGDSFVSPWGWKFTSMLSAKGCPAARNWQVQHATPSKGNLHLYVSHISVWLDSMSFNLLSMVVTAVCCTCLFTINRSDLYCTMWHATCSLFLCCVDRLTLPICDKVSVDQENKEPSSDKVPAADDAKVIIAEPHVIPNRGPYVYSQPKRLGHIFLALISVSGVCMHFQG